MINSYRAQKATPHSKRSFDRTQLGKPLIQVQKKWSRSVWSVAVLPIHGVIYTFEAEKRTRWSDMTAWFVWAPTPRPMPSRAPTGWGIVSGDPFDELVDALQGQPSYILREDETDWSGLIDLLELDADTTSPFREQLNRLRVAKRRERLRWVTQNYQKRSLDDVQRTGTGGKYS